MCTGTDLDINFNFYLEYLAIFGYFYTVRMDSFDQKLKELKETLDALRPTPNIQQALQNILNILAIATYSQRKQSRIKRERHITAALEKFGTSSIREILKELPWIKRPTLKSDLARMVRIKKIKKEGVKKGVVYFL